MDLRANRPGPGIDINISHPLSNKEISQHVRKSQRLNFVSSRIKCVFLIYRFIAIKFDTKARQSKYINLDILFILTQSDQNCLIPVLSTQSIAVWPITKRVKNAKLIILQSIYTII